jgi:predicted  nucleic acid-binding Zn-ribbon protein
MSKVYQSVRGVVQGTLHRRKPDIMVSARVKNNDGSLNDAIEELEKTFLDGVTRLKAAVGDDQAAVATEAQHAEQVIEELRANITALEARLKETEDGVQATDAASHKMEESLSAEIRDLQSVVKKKEEALGSRDSEVSDLKSKINVLTEQVAHLRLAIQQAKGEAASEAHDAKQVIEGLRANIIVLEARLRETEDSVQGKDVASQKMEESLSTEIRDLQSVVKKKEEALGTRDSEINDLKSKIDVLTEQVAHLELAIQQAKVEAASEVQDAEQVIKSLKVEIATLHDQLRQTEQIVSGTESSINGFDQNRNNQAIHLNADLEPPTNAVKDSKAEALLGIQAQAIDTVVTGEKLKPGEEKPTDFHFQAAGVTSILTEAARDTVSQEAFERMIAHFSELANVIESIASLIVRDHVRVLGESIEQFPQERLTELLEALSKEISDDKLKTDFCQRFGKV